jgi:hypothetical protein
VLTEVGAVIDDHGGAFEARYATVLWAAARA